MLLARRARGHFVTLIEIRVHLIRVKPGHTFQVKQSAKVMVWGDMTGRGLTKLHILPSGQTSTSKH